MICHEKKIQQISNVEEVNKVTGGFRNVSEMTKKPFLMAKMKLYPKKDHSYLQRALFYPLLETIFLIS